MDSTNTSFQKGLNTINARLNSLVTSPDGKFTYTSTCTTGNNQVTAYAVNNTTVALTKVGSEVELDSLGTGLLTFNPNGQWLYALGYSCIFVLQVQSNGTLQLVTPVNPLPPTVNIRSIAVSSDGNYLYALQTDQVNQGPASSRILSYAIDPITGNLSALSTPVTNVANNSTGICLVNNSAQIVVTAASGSFPQKGTVSVYNRSTTTGILSSTSTVTAANSAFPNRPVLTGQFLYILDNEVIVYPNAVNPVAYISAFKVDPVTAALTPVTNSPYSPPDSPSKFVASNKHLYAFTAAGFYQDAPQTILRYSINPTSGALSLDPVTVPIPVTNYPGIFSLDNAEHILYAAVIETSSSATLYVYNTEFPYVTSTVTTTQQLVTVSATISNPKATALKSSGFYYSNTNSSPGPLDTVIANAATSGNYSATIPAPTLQTGSVYYIRPFAVAPSGETYLGPINTFQLAFPTVTSFSNSPIGAGKQLTITGQFFSAIATQNLVTFTGGTTAIPTASSATQLTVTVPANTQTGPVTVTSNGIVGYPSQPLLIQALPLIKSFSPTIGPGSTLVTISGAGFHTPTVTFNGVSGIVQSTSPDGTTIQVKAPANVTTGPIVVTCNNISSLPSTTNFELQLQPTITEVQAHGATGQSLTIAGTNFSPNGSNTVYFQSAPPTKDSLEANPLPYAQPTYVSSTLMIVTIPPNAISGPISVNCNGVMSANSTTSPKILQVGPRGTPTNSFVAVASNGAGLQVAATNAGYVYVNEANKGWAQIVPFVEQFFEPNTVLRLTSVIYSPARTNNPGYFAVFGYTTKKSQNGADLNTGYMFSSLDGAKWSTYTGSYTLLGNTVITTTNVVAARNYPSLYNDPRSYLISSGSTPQYITGQFNGTGANVTSIAIGPNAIVAVTDTNTIVCYQAGWSARQVASLPATGFTSVTWSPVANAFIAVGLGGVWMSVDGTSWALFSPLPPLASAEKITRVCSNSTYLVFGTAYGRVVATSDLKNYFQIVSASAPGNNVKVSFLQQDGTGFYMLNNQNEGFLIQPS